MSSPQPKTLEELKADAKQEWDATNSDPRKRARFALKHPQLVHYLKYQPAKLRAMKLHIENGALTAGSEEAKKAMFAISAFAMSHRHRGCASAKVFSRVLSFDPDDRAQNHFVQMLLRGPTLTSEFAKTL